MVDMLVPSVGAMVPGIWGPQRAPDIGGGKGAVPLLKQILLPRPRGLQPVQPQVLVLKLSISSIVRPYVPARPEQVSPAAIVYACNQSADDRSDVLRNEEPSSQEEGLW